jgi:arabinose-5-phosphate isomerase
LPIGGCAIEDNGMFAGILVEGDIRRTFAKDHQGLQTKIKDIMNTKPVTIGIDQLAFEALQLMESKNHTFQLLPVIENKKFLGVIRLHELLKEGFSLKK